MFKNYAYEGEIHPERDVKWTCKTKNCPAYIVLQGTVMKKEYVIHDHEPNALELMQETSKVLTKSKGKMIVKMEKNM